MVSAQRVSRSALADSSAMSVADGSSWPQHSYQIALRLHARGEWPAYLTAAEVPWVTKAMESQELWDRFISPRPEQWRFHAPPPPIFEIPAAGTPVQTTTPIAHAQLQKRQAAIASTSKLSATYSGKRIAHQGSDLAGAVPAKSGKRARAATAASLDSDDDMLSVLSGSDIDMAVWTNDASITPNADSPESISEVAVTKLAPSASSDSPAGDLAAAEGSLVCALAAFHARSAIFEQYVSVLCGPRSCSRCTDVVLAVDDFAATRPKPELGELSPATDHSDKLLAAGINDDSMDVEVPPLVSTNMPAPLISRKIDEDEEYDDDEDDYGNDGDGDVNMAGESTRQPEKAVVLGHLVACEHRANGTLPDGVGRVTSQQQKQHLSSLAEPVDLGKSGDKHANSGTPTMLNVALHAVFHTLEDLPSVVRDQDLYEDSVRQIKGVMQQRAAEPKDMLVSKIGSMQNMKNLAQFIDNHRDSVNMSTRELSHLLSEVRPKRTKWANERRVGQVELYDALENVLSELKNMGDVSAPFLSQVKRKDAPDYYKVIKHPMDLSAMAKNLRNEMYNSKRQFTDHLQLIRDNCYTYNTEPGNYYRKSVDTMLAKARQLMDAVPDIVVRDKSNGGGDDAQTECGDESGNESQSARMMYGQREGSVLADEGTPAPGTADYNSLQSSTSMMRASSDCLGVFESTSANTSQQLPLPLQHQQPSQPKLTALALNIQRVTGTGATAHIAISDLAEGYDLPLGEKIWRSRTRKRISAYHRQLEQDAAASALNTQRALVRTAENMRAFANSTHDAREAVSVQDVQAIEHGADVSDLRTIFVPVAGTSEAGEARRRNEELDWERKEWLRAAEELDSHGWPFVSECEPVAGLPQLETLEEQAGRSGVLQWLNDDCEATVDAVLQGSAAYDGSSGGSGDAMHAQPSIDAYATARFPDNEMWRAMADNVDCLRNIRAIDSKIWASRLNIPVGMLQPEAPEEKSRGTRGQHSADEQGHILTRDMHSSYAMRPDPPAPFSLDAPSARKLLDRTSAFMLAHTGFDAATSSAISTLSGFFADFITNLGRTLRTYSDKHSRTMSAEAMLAHSLYSNGVEDLSELEYYMRGEVRKHGNKLLELQKKIVKSYQDSMSDGRLDSAAPPDASALESGDAFMIGSVNGLGDLGDDFFGFKELGLDKELGLEQLTVPARLWHGKSAASAETELQAIPEDVLAHPAPRPWTPIATPRGQIGLLRRFLCEKLKAANGMDPPGFEVVANGEEVSTETGEDKKHGAAESANDEPMAAAPAVVTADGSLPEQWVPIPEDEAIPVKLRYGAARAKVPPSNYLTHPRTHMHVGSGQLPAAAQTGRSAKKKPSKTTTTTTAAAAKSMVAATGGKSTKKK